MHKDVIASYPAVTFDGGTFEGVLSLMILKEESAVSVRTGYEFLFVCIFLLKNVFPLSRYALHIILDVSNGMLMQQGVAKEEFIAINSPE